MDDEDLYLTATDEVDNQHQEPALWSKAMALCEGDLDKAKYKYINLRVDKLRNVKDTTSRHGASEAQKKIYSKNIKAPHEDEDIKSNYLIISEYGKLHSLGRGAILQKVSDGILNARTYNNSWYIEKQTPSEASKPLSDINSDPNNGITKHLPEEPPVDCDSNSQENINSTSLYITLNGRIRRRSFFTGIVLSILLIKTSLNLLMASRYSIEPNLIYILLGCIVIIGVMAITSLTVKRLHDLGKPGLYAWLMLIPIANALVIGALIFMKGEKGNNKYGPEP